MPYQNHPVQIKIINGNTFDEMTANINAVAQAAARPGTVIVTTQPERGPLTIESYYDEYLAIPGILEEIIKDEARFDAFIVACWGDPGVEAARELTSKPVIGIAEASMYVANALGAKFGVVTTLARTRHMVESTVAKVGLAEHCAAVICTDLPVKETEANREATFQALERGSQEAIKAGAEVIVLACAGMSGLDSALEEVLGLTVIDSMAAAVAWAEALVSLGKKTSKALTYRPPELKPVKGYPAHMQTGAIVK